MQKHCVDRYYDGHVSDGSRQISMTVVEHIEVLGQSYGTTICIL